ncbi:hypothetical protein HHK36_030263 [Tetracentron sinense]|uniref:MADS-box domain-containing protein n=1 Tax=Tetracentron sinense TaxID=13715 RepID=A0A834YD63_TETSI|nr:hypothetical protein HHK36_030263 [Tetracentron sinense]
MEELASLYGVKVLLCFNDDGPSWGSRRNITNDQKKEILGKSIFKEKSTKFKFSKRKLGLKKKMEELSILCGVEGLLLCSNDGFLNQKIEKQMTDMSKKKQMKEEVDSGHGSIEGLGFDQLQQVLNQVESARMGVEDQVQLLEMTKNSKEEEDSIWFSLEKRNEQESSQNDEGDFEFQEAELIESEEDNSVKEIGSSCAKFDKPMWKEVQVTGIAKGKNSGGATNWRCPHCSKEWTSTYTRVYAHFFGAPPCQPKKRIDISRCTVLLKNRKLLLEIRKRVEIAEKQGLFLDLKRSSLTVDSHSLKKKGVLEDVFKQQERSEVDAKILRALCACGIPFNVLKSPYFHEMVSSINSGPKGYKCPSFEKVRTSLLDNEKQRLDRDLHVVRDTWPMNGFSIISDGWTSIKDHPLINLIAANSLGAMQFEEVGPSNVIQVLIDNAANCVLAGKEVAKDGAVIGEVYEGLEDMLDKIKDNLKDVEEESLFLDIQRIVNARRKKMNVPLHSLAYALTPHYYDSKYIASPAPGGRNRSRPVDDVAVDDDLFTILRGQFAKFSSQSALFSMQAAKVDAFLMPAIEWWSMYDAQTTQLAEVARRVLSQPAIDLKPFGGLHIIHRNRSAARLAMGNLSGALEDAKEALTIAPQYPQVGFTLCGNAVPMILCCTKQAYICQGDAFLAMDELDAAEKSYTMALQIDPSIRRSKSFKPAMVKEVNRIAIAAAFKQLEDNKEAVVREVHNGSQTITIRILHFGFVSTLLEAVELGSFHWVSFKMSQMRWGSKSCREYARIAQLQQKLSVRFHVDWWREWLTIPEFSLEGYEISILIISMLWAIWKARNDAASARFTRVKALFIGLSIVESRGWRKSVLEGDASLLMDVVNNKDLESVSEC